NDPGELVLLQDAFGVARPVAVKWAGKRKNVEVRIRLIMARPFGDDGNGPIRGIEAISVEPVSKFRVTAVFFERRRFQDGEVLPQGVHDADLVSILKVAPDTRQIDFDIDAKSLELAPWADAGQHQELGRIECAASEDNFVLGADGTAARV